MNSRKNALQSPNGKNPALGTTRRKKSEIRCLPASVKGKKTATHKTTQGWRYESDAQTACDKLSAVGYDCWVAFDGKWYRIEWTE